MNEVVLVTGSETLTGRKLIEKLLKRGSHVVAPVPGRETETSKTGTPNLTVLTWNRASWFSTKAVVQETIRLHSRIDAVWLLHLSMMSRLSFSETGSSDVESVLEQSVKGSVALTREVTPHLQASGGFIGMVLPHRSGGAPSPLDALADGAFTGFATSFLREVSPSLWACGFSSKSPDADGFTSELLELQNEKPTKLRGRWYNFTGERRLLRGSKFSNSIG